MEYNAKNVEMRTKELRKEFGSSKKLAEAAGCPISAVIHYCSPAYLEKHLPAKNRWEKHFGPWDRDANLDIHAEEITEDTAEETEVMTEQKPEQPDKVSSTARIIIEVPSLQELEKTLSQFGFMIKFVKKN